MATEQLKAPHSDIDAALRAHDAQKALALAAKYAKSGSASAREAAIEIAKIAGAAYRDFVIEPVHDFAAEAEAELPPEVGPTVAKAVGRLVTMTEDWEQRLSACYEERLARELRDFVRLKKWQEALENVKGLCSLSETERSRDAQAALKRRAEYVGAVLGTCLNHPREAENLVSLVLREPDAYGLTRDLAEVMFEARRKRHDQMMGSSMDNIENQWSATLRSTQVDIQQAMPGKNKMGEPDEDDLRTVGDLFRAVLRVPLWRRHGELFLDATLVLTDFVPKDVAEAARQSGVEGRSYANIGFTARKAVAMTFMEIGQSGNFVERFEPWAKENLDRPQKPQIIELMGALRTERWAPLFMEMWKDRRHRDVKTELATALSNLATPDSAEVLFEELEAVLKKSVIGPAEVRESRRLLEALGRVVRSPRTPEPLQKEIIRRTIDLVPEDNNQLSRAAVQSVLAAKPKLLTDKQRRRAIETLVESLWIQDQSTGMHRGGERETNILGARQGLVTALQRLATDEMDTMLQEFEKRAMRYSGAYMAAAEVLEKLNEPRAVPVLSNMLLSAAMHDTSRQSEYQKETYWDPTAQERRPLTRDKVMAPLVFALGTIGGDEAEKTLRDLYQRIESGRVENPGQETMEYLGRFLGPDKVGPGAKGTEEKKEGRLPESDPDEVKVLIKTLTKSYFLKSGAKRAEAKIPALARIGQLTPPDALDAVFENLTEKEQMISSAAITAAAEYAGTDKPRSLINLTVDRTLQGMESKDPAMRVACTKLLTEIGPNRPDIRKKVSAFARTAERGEVKLALRTALKEVSGGTPTSPTGEQVQTEPTPASGGGQSQAPPVPEGVSKLELKQQYMKARQEWIRGGKKGDPPSPPPGL